MVEGEFPARVMPPPFVRACAQLRFRPRRFERIKFHLAKPGVTDGRVASDQSEVQNFRRRGNHAVKRIAGKIFGQIIGGRRDCRREFQQFNVRRQTVFASGS